MHDIDRTLFEGEIGEYEGEGEYEYEYEGEGESGYEAAEASEAQELALASELLEVTNEQELEQFLGRLLAGAGRLAASPLGQQVKGILRTAARQVLPIAGRAVGGRAAGTSGARLGAQAGRAAASMLGLELEGLSQEDREFEVARAYVRFARDVGRRAATIPAGAPPAAAARAAAINAARQHAPGLAQALAAPAGRSPGASAGQSMKGRWRRQGRTIVLYDL